MVWPNNLQVNKIISNNYVLITPNPYTLRAKQINKKDWIYNTKNKSIGKISSIKGQQAIIHHWTTNQTDPILQPCSGCNLNETQLQKTKCTFIQSILNLGQIIIDSKHKIRYNIDELAAINFSSKPNWTLTV